MKGTEETVKLTVIWGRIDGMSTRAKWSEYPLACMFGLHKREQHPGISSFWQCVRCEWGGRK